MASFLWPVAPSRQLWHFAIKLKMEKCKEPTDIAFAILYAVHTIPHRISLFVNRFHEYTMPLTTQSRLRDILPLPWPCLDPVYAWMNYTGGSRRKRARFVKNALLCLWRFLVTFGLNFEYIGRLSPDHWRHDSTLIQSRKQAVLNIDSAIQYFVEGTPQNLDLPCWHSETSKKRLDYQGDKVSIALPI